jgi:hypothetical protein
MKSAFISPGWGLVGTAHSTGLIISLSKLLDPRLLDRLRLRIDAPLDDERCIILGKDVAEVIEVAVNTESLQFSL